MRVLVTGATGFLGGWLTRRLIEEGCQVRIIKRPASPLEEIADLPLEILPGDVTDPQSLINAAQGVDAVFHLAGLVAYARKDRAAMDRINVQGTQNVIDACTKAGVGRLVHLSSVVAVGASFDGKKPLDENSPYNVGQLNLGYFETKHQAEALVQNAVQNRGLDAVMINPGTIYGPADAKKGSRKTQVKVARGKFPLYPPGGVNVVSVEDVVDAIVAGWRKGRTGERYIVASENLLIKDAFDMIAREAGVKPPSIALPRPAIFALGYLGDFMQSIGQKGPLTVENAWTSVLYHWFDGSKANREFGLKPKPASYAIGQSVKWMKDNGLLDDKS